MNNGRPNKVKALAVSVLKVGDVDMGTFFSVLQKSDFNWLDWSLIDHGQASTRGCSISYIT